MSLSSITFDVFGIPAPQGSTRAFNIGGRARVTNAATPKHNAWRDSVAAMANAVLPEVGNAPLDGAVELAVEIPIPDA